MKKSKLKKKLCKQCHFGVKVGKKYYCTSDLSKLCKCFVRDKDIT